jgi:hypothetical protein
MKNVCVAGLVGIIGAIFTGCGTEIKVTASPNASVGTFRTAYLEIHNDPPNDMDKKMEAAIACHNVTVTTG